MDDDRRNGSKYVLIREFDRLEKEQQRLEEKVSDLNGDMKELRTTIKIKSGIWSAIGGAIPILVMLGYYMVTRGVK